MTSLQDHIPQHADVPRVVTLALEAMEANQVILAPEVMAKTLAQVVMEVALVVKSPGEAQVGVS